MNQRTRRPVAGFTLVFYRSASVRIKANYCLIRVIYGHALMEAKPKSQQDLLCAPRIAVRALT